MRRITVVERKESLPLTRVIGQGRDLGVVLFGGEMRREGFGAYVEARSKEVVHYSPG